MTKGDVEEWSQDGGRLEIYLKLQITTLSSAAQHSKTRVGLVAYILAQQLKNRVSPLDNGLLFSDFGTVKRTPNDEIQEIGSRRGKWGGFLGSSILSQSCGQETPEK
jgi:hypothetical protein